MSKLVKKFGFFSEVKSELKKVTWSTREQTIKHLTVVLSFVALMSVFLGGLDYLFTYLVSLFIR